MLNNDGDGPLDISFVMLDIKSPIAERTHQGPSTPIEHVARARTSAALAPHHGTATKHFAEPLLPKADSIFVPSIMHLPLALSH